jgi:hypothetical protein
MFLASLDGHSRLLERDGQTNPRIRPLDYIPTENNEQVQYFTFLQGVVILPSTSKIDIYLRLSPADRFHQGCATSDTARNVVAYRIRLENPEVSPAEAQRLALQRAYFQ